MYVVSAYVAGNIVGYIHYMSVILPVHYDVVDLLVLLSVVWVTIVVCYLPVCCEKKILFLKNVFMTLNGKQIPNTIRNYKLNWASHGTSRHNQNHGGGPPQDGSNPPGMHRMGSNMSGAGGVERGAGGPGGDMRMGNKMMGGGGYSGGGYGGEGGNFHGHHGGY